MNISGKTVVIKTSFRT